MTSLRHAIGFVLNLLILQLTVLGGGVACPRHELHGDASATPHRHASAAQASHAAHGTDGGGGHGDATSHARSAGSHGSHVAGGVAMEIGHGAAPGELPTHGTHDGVPHCATAPGCAPVALASTDAALPTVHLAAARVAPGSVDVPRSPTLSPEPPPPRV